MSSIGASNFIKKGRTAIAVPEHESGPEPRYAGFWLRFLAHLIDYLVLLTASALLELVVLGTASWLRSLSPEPVISQVLNPMDPVLLQSGLTALYVAFSLPYYVIGHSRYGSTLGKRALSLGVRDASGLELPGLGQCFVRYLAYGASWFFMLGYFMVGISHRKRGLHDWIAGTVVVRLPRPARPSAR